MIIEPIILDTKYYEIPTSKQIISIFKNNGKGSTGINDVDYEVVFGV